MIRMYEKQSAFTARQVLAVIIALILMSAFLPSRAAVAEDEPFIEIEDIEWDENAFVILDDPIYFMGDEDMEVPVITSAGKTNVKVNGVKSKNKLVKYTIPEMLLRLDPNFMDLMIEAEKYIGYPKPALTAPALSAGCSITPACTAPDAWAHRGFTPCVRIFPVRKHGPAIWCSLKRPWESMSRELPMWGSTWATI